MENSTLQMAEKYALENMDGGVMLINRQGEIVYANETARTIFEMEHPFGATYRDLFFRDDGSNDNMIDLITESIFAPGRKQDRVVRYQNSKGRSWMLHFFCTALKQDENTFVLTFTDQTEAYQGRIRYQDSTVILSLLLAITGLWTVIVAFWEWKGRFWAADSLTTWIEIIGFFMVYVFVKSSSLTIKDFGISFANWKDTLKRTLIRVVVLWAAFAAVKGIRMLGNPNRLPFWDWSQADFRLVTYLFTALLQEFLSRGVCQEALMRVLPGKYKEQIAIGMTALFFMSVHLQRGLIFMLGSGILSVLLGVLYRKDRNIYGVTVIHYCFGKFADFFGFL